MVSFGGIVRGTFGFLFRRVIPLLVLLTALLLGFLSKQEEPEGFFFAAFFPLMNKRLPPIMFGHGRLSDMVPEIPSDAVAMPPPPGMTYLSLPGDSTGGPGMPSNGIGMCCRPSAYDDETVYRTVLWYLLKGGRLVDTAQIYLNHKAVGRGVRAAVEKYGIPRRDIFVTTKLWPRNFGADAAAAAVPRFVEELGLDYVDLLLLHFPVRFVPGTSTGCDPSHTPAECRAETWRVLSKFRDEGVVKHLGVSNHNIDQIKGLKEIGRESGAAPVAVHQMQFNPWAPRELVNVFDYCVSEGVAVTAHTSLAGYVQYSQAANVDVLQKFALKHERTVSQILLKWALQKGAAIIPGTGNPEHMVENLNMYNFELSDEDMAQINALGLNEREAKKFIFMPLNDDQ